MVVPELPQLISLLGGVRTRFFPCTINVAGSGCSILIPSARNAFTVCIQSSLGRNPCRVHTPFDKAAIITARCEMLLSPGTVISMSIRGARFTRNSIDKKKPLVDTQYGMLNKGRRRANSARSISLEHPQGNPLRNKKDFVRVRILYFRSRRKSFHIDIFAGGIRTLYQVRLARNGDSVRIVPFRDLRRRGWWRRWRRCGLHGRCTRRLSRAIRIEWLLWWRVLLGLGRGIARGPMSGGWRLWLFTA